MIYIRAPGRICLFGEHQDYLDYPVIAMAISRYIFLEAKKITEPKFKIELLDIEKFIEIPLKNKELEYESRRDYMRSGYNQFIRKGNRFEVGYEIKIKGNIPINAGASSSSALVIAWLSFLNKLCGEPLTKVQLANEGYNTEVLEFKEAGGMMDFFTIVFGNLIYLDFQTGKPDLERINTTLKGFVLGDSLEKKNTVKDLMRVKDLSHKGFIALKEIMPMFNQYTTSLEEISPFLPSLDKESQKKIMGNICNRDLTKKARFLLQEHVKLAPSNTNKFYKRLGSLLIKHQNSLENDIEIGTKKIHELIKYCLKAGALGGKINGSGFGGTFFMLAPNNENKIKETMEQNGAEAFLINQSNGVESY